MSGRTLMWLIRSVTVGLATLVFLGFYVLGGRDPIAMMGAIGMAATCVYCAVGAKASSSDDKAKSRNNLRSKS